MTANLTITIDERNNVLKVPNSALRFTPQDASGQRVRCRCRRTARAGGQGRRRQQQVMARRATVVVRIDLHQRQLQCLPGQIRVVWVLGQDGKPERRRITVGSE